MSFRTPAAALVLIVLVGAMRFMVRDPGRLNVEEDTHVVLVGNNLCSRMLHFGHFETEMYLRHPGKRITIRNLCDGGNTPGFRPHSGRPSPWAFPGAERFQDELARDSGSDGHFETPDQWLTRLEADVILAFFGYSESFRGEEGLADFRAELDAFVQHTINKRYNGESPPQLALISPTAFEDLSGQYDPANGTYDLPAGKEENKHLALYTEAMRGVAGKHDVLFIDTFASSETWFADSDKPLTIDGLQLNDAGYRELAAYLGDAVFAESAESASRTGAIRAAIHEAVREKNWIWHNYFKIPNGVHVFGRRYKPYGPENYPAELAKLREMTAIRDTAIWSLLDGTPFDVEAADRRTTKLPEVETNYRPNDREVRYLYGDEAVSTLETAPGYRIELFASEQEFPDLANPVQLSFDNHGRLWVATMPSYPHYKPGDPKPNDKLLILEDTDMDGRADRQTTFAENLHLPLGFELAPEGVYVSQGTNLVLLKDTDADDEADEMEIVLSGFDDHDTHHAHSTYTADPSGAIYMAEGVFLHTNVETPYGPVRGTNGGFYRYNPQRRRLERTAQLAIPNPWGIAFDDWGQPFFAETSSPYVRWMMPGTVKPRYGVSTHKSYNLIEEEHLVRPTSGLEFVSSRHFPDEVQGDLLINNTIGFLGTKQHAMVDDSTGYRSYHRQDLVQGTDPNFRPVDMEFAPDGSLYLVDWHNVLIGHMQHNARDPLRDHVHGRIYRITHPSRPLVEPPVIAGAPVDLLLENLKLPEYRARYRTRRELRGRAASEVIPKLRAWVAALDEKEPDYEQHLLEALWVTWGLNRVDAELLRRVLRAEDFRVRAAAVRVLRYTGHQIDDQSNLLLQAAQDDHGRVRLEAIVAASWLDEDDGLQIVDEAGKKPLDRWMVEVHATAEAHLKGQELAEQQEQTAVAGLEGEALNLFRKGKEIYNRDGYCATCHQTAGEGLTASGFPPLARTKWVLGSEERLIKLTLKGLQGPIEVLERSYGGDTPMTAFEGLLSDEEVAAVLTYVRNAFGNSAPAVMPGTVEKVREAIEHVSGFYSPDELLREHPFAKDGSGPDLPPPAVLDGDIERERTGEEQ